MNPSTVARVKLLIVAATAAVLIAVMWMHPGALASAVTTLGMTVGVVMGSLPPGASTIIQAAVIGSIIGSVLALFIAAIRG